MAGGLGFSFSAAGKDELLRAVEERWQEAPRAAAHTRADNVYEVGDDRLLFVGEMPAPEGPRVRAILLQRWSEELRAGRQPLVPPFAYYRDHDGLLYRCALAYHMNLPLALHGHTGVGKTELVRHFAALLGAPLYRMNLHGLSTTDDIIGKLLPGGAGTVYFQDGLVTTAVRHGGILLLEEMNATGQEVWFSLHGLLDGSRSLVLVEKDNEVVTQHSNCRVFSTFNPAEYPNLYPGTKELSVAYLRRWLSVRMGFLPLDVEREILLRRFPALSDPPHDETLEIMLEVARVARSILLARTSTFNFVLSTGVLESWAALALHTDPLTAARMTFYDLLEERVKVLFREQVFAYVTPWDLSSLEEGETV
jgi:MoxR-like ATPase